MTVVQDDVIRATVEMDVNDNALQNVYHFRSTNVATIGDSQALTDMGIIADTLYTFLLAQMSTDADFNQIRAQNVTQDVLLGTTGFPVLVSGSNVADVLPQQDAGIITYPTAKPLTRGSSYYGGLTEGANGSDGTMTASILAALANVAVLMLAEIVVGPNSWRYVVFNTVLKTFVLPTASSIPSVMRTQRRRRPGVGI